MELILQIDKLKWSRISFELWFREIDNDYTVDSKCRTCFSLSCQSQCSFPKKAPSSRKCHINYYCPNIDRVFLIKLSKIAPPSAIAALITFGNPLALRHFWANNKYLLRTTVTLLPIWLKAPFLHEQKKIFFCSLNSAVVCKLRLNSENFIMRY